MTTGMKIINDFKEWRQWRREREANMAIHRKLDAGFNALVMGFSGEIKKQHEEGGRLDVMAASITLDSTPSITEEWLSKHAIGQWDLLAIRAESPAHQTLLMAAANENALAELAQFMSANYGGPMEGETVIDCAKRLIANSNDGSETHYDMARDGPFVDMQEIDDVDHG